MIVTLVNSELAQRIYPDEPHPEDPRTPFQHDKDRILYSTAFRRLQYKTQVYAIHEGDLYRTRLTHTLEVAQIARALAMFLKADVDLAEAIALAHDIGHAPFGHAGSEKLKELAAAHGVSFEHNLQAYRVVSSLEESYASFGGLNLTRATLEGILRHCTYFDNQKEIRSSIPSDLAAEVSIYWDSPQPTAEAQIVNVADVIAYASHDIEDALSVDLIDWDNFTSRVRDEKVTFLEEIIDKELAQYEMKYKQPRSNSSTAAYSKLRNRVTSRLIVDRLIRETVKQTTANLTSLCHRRGEVWLNVRKSKSATVAFPDFFENQVRKLVDEVLFRHVYQEPRVLIMTEKGKRILEVLFNCFMSQPRALPLITQARLSPYFGMSDEDRSSEKGEKILAQGVVDYISGMTDKYAMDMYQLLTQAYERAL